MEENKDLGLLFIRLGLAAVFIAHGWAKLSGLGDAGETFNDLGAPLPGALAFIAALIEFVGGIAILLGVFSRWAAGLIACVMAVAILEVKFSRGLIGGFEFELMLLLAALAIVFAGPGRMNLLDIIRAKKN